MRNLGYTATTVIGWLARIHPLATNFQEIEQEIKKSLQKVTPDPTEKQRWEQTLAPQEKLAFANGATPVPPIRVFTSTRRATVKEKKFQFETLNVKTASKHKSWIFHLLSQADQHNLLPQQSKFIPHKLDPRDITYKGVVDSHVTFVSQLKVIPIVGLTKDAAEHKDHNNVTYLHHIKTAMNAVTIQPTTRTHDLGKWLIQVKQSDYPSAENYVDVELPRTYKGDILPEKHLEGFPFPRRTQIPLRTEAMGAYANTLRELAKDGLALPQTTPKKPRRKQAPLTFHPTKDDFPPLAWKP